MCNLYSMTRPRDAVRQAFRVTQDRTANQPPLRRDPGMPGSRPQAPPKQHPNGGAA